ncbi:MAG TPA: DUF6174 domain-containing protein [Gemmatimonadales bacterium]|nr:DUF6174 domain-containing protein [Gemmatimonadales bacterium]
MVRRIMPFGLSLVLCSVSCGDPLGADRDQLAESQARWGAQGVATYEFDVRISCFCVAASYGSVTISVDNRQVVSVVRTDSGTPVDSQYFQGVLTVERMFATLRHFLDAKPAFFTASYDRRWGFPTSLGVDPIRNAADDEYGFTVLAFRTITR